jgi:hypothetical protein
MLIEIRRAPVALEFALLTAIVIGVAVAGSLISRRLGTNQDVPLEIAICFLVALIVYHAWFYFVRRYHTKNVTKYIDYLYLGVAAIGLLAAGLEFSRQQHEADVRAAFEHALDGLGQLPTLMEDLAYLQRHRRGARRACRRADQPRRTAVEALGKIVGRRPNALPRRG